MVIVVIIMSALTYRKGTIITIAGRLCQNGVTTPEILAVAHAARYRPSGSCPADHNSNVRCDS